MPYFKKNTGFDMGYTPYTSPHSSSPFNYGVEDQLKSIKHGMKNAKFEYKHKMATGTRSRSARQGYRENYKRQMAILKERYKSAKNSGKKKFTLNPFKAKGIYGLG